MLKIMRLAPILTSPAERPIHLQDQHAIAVTVKTIALANGFLISTQQELAPGERAHEHEQSRARQMEIRKQKIDMLKLIRRINEKIGGAVLRDYFVVFPAGRLEDAHARCPHRNQPARLLDLTGRFS